MEEIISTPVEIDWSLVSPPDTLQRPRKGLRLVLGAFRSSTTRSNKSYYSWSSILVCASQKIAELQLLQQVLGRATDS